MAFLERGALDEIYIVPGLLGDGPLLFPAISFAASPKLISAAEADMGCVRPYYRFD